MKPKHILLTLLCLSIGYTAEAQLLKKLRKKAEAAVERTLLKKTDEVVSKKTGQVVDTLSTSKKKNKKGNKKGNKSTDSVASVQKNKPSAKKPALKNDKADLHLQASVQPFATQLGGAVTFTIAVNNKGPAIANAIASKVHIPKSYAISNISVTQGAYNRDSKLWDVGTLEAWDRAVMTIMAVVMDDTDLMTTGEIISSSVLDPDSTPNNGIDTNGNGLIIDDKGDEDDGDGQDVKLGEVMAGNGTGNSGNSTGYSDSGNSNVDAINTLIFDQDIKMVMEHKRDKIISYLDFDTMAMRLEDHSKGKKNDPMYWDKDGYIYSGDKGQYYKIKFEQVMNMGKNMIKMFTGPIQGMPMDLPKVNGKEVDLEWHKKPIIYNGYELYVAPNRYPMVEWVFIYHPQIFRGAAGVEEETVPCRGSSNCIKFSVTQGEGAGSSVLFDFKGRLAEITNPDGAVAIYTYEPSTVTLPTNAQEFNFNFQQN
ncbi:DUF11 domain-containing protein [Winogradskyella ouciana]|uniref:DUF11 domain-containing protein n=1 Tax=Winogradskyella ouciana TaxID=2608631 RepID=A0A7K1GAA3_9FLAO|nr:DUF11 domain-containing protein [Winogradskyella ouciana]MTE26071.1 hypothetical protein [Winogradskyella ouciana]